MSNTLLRRPKGTSGQIHEVTPQNAGWEYVGFEVRILAKGDSLTMATGAREYCAVLLAGKVRVNVAGKDYGIIGGRNSPFDGLPWSAYVPAHTTFTLSMETDCELALCSSPAQGKAGLQARIITPDETGEIVRGSGSNTRHVRNILPEDHPAESLLVVEVITPGGHWSSYPPHKHDRDALPAESALEETYYHRVDPPQGFAVQRVYTDDRSLDETMCVQDRDVVLVPRGYHPVGASHGYNLYYLNVMAGPRRIWRFYNDPAHEWLLK